jgi:Na+/H+ antiporter NhaD/arsenite permease-like protein
LGAPRRAKSNQRIEGPYAVSIAGIPLEYFLFGATLLGVALFHHYTLQVAVTGAVVISLYKLLVVAGFSLPVHLAHEWVTLANLLGLLLGFALLADHFERSEVPAALPAVLPDDWKGGFVLLVLVFVLSSFLDNIAAAMIGGSMAAVLYQKRVHIGFLAGIVAASNAGGSGSVVGDTTTTMMWIAGASPWQVLDAYIAAGTALIIFGVLAARQQHAYQPILADTPAGVHVQWARLAIVAVILLAAVGANVWFNLQAPDVLDHWPVIGIAVWIAIMLTATWRKPNWALLPDALRGSIFLLSLVWCASLMPVEHLPTPSWQSALGLGFLSAIFDNIPLTSLALHQGGYDWGFLAYAVGFGGSMLWFGSSAGVALSNMYPEARSAMAWLRGGWHVALAYVVGFLVLLAVLGWHPEPLRRAVPPTPSAAVATEAEPTAAPMAPPVAPTAVVAPAGATK